MRVVIDARESGTSTGRYVDKLIEYLHKLKPDFAVTVLTKAQRMDYLRTIAPDFDIQECGYREFSFGEQYGFVWQLYGLKADLVHFGMTQQPVLYFGEAVTTIHDLTTARFRNPAKNRLMFSIKQEIYRWVIRIVAHKSLYLITPSQFVKKDVAQYTKIDPKKIIVTYEAADRITAKAEPFKKLVGQKFIMYVGRAQPHKNLERLVNAFIIIQKSQPDLKLALVGKKDVLYRRLEKKVRKNEVSDVIFTDFVSEGQLRWLYENCATYVFPSLSEGFGLPPLEAMIHGAPVVSSDASCLPEISGAGALYFDPLDMDDMATKISSLLDDRKLRAKLASAGYEQALKYSWQRMAQQTLDVYNKILN